MAKAISADIQKEALYRHIDDFSLNYDSVKHQLVHPDVKLQFWYYLLFLARSIPSPKSEISSLETIKIEVKGIIKEDVKNLSKEKFDNKISNDPDAELERRLGVFGEILINQYIDSIFFVMSDSDNKKQYRQLRLVDMDKIKNMDL